MDKFSKLLQAQMTLMEGKELRFGSSIPGNDKLELCKKAIESIEGYMKNINEKPEDYLEEDGAKFQIKVELVKLNKPYFEGQ